VHHILQRVEGCQQVESLEDEAYLL